MKISIFGTGYVGLVTGACLADSGHNVICVDIDQAKIEQLTKGNVPLYEPQLQELVQDNLAQNRLRFTSDSKTAVEHGEIIYIATGTPSRPDGSADASQVFAVAEQIALYLRSNTIIVNKSTVPVGTSEQIANQIAKVQSAMGRSDIEFDVCSNPEFLKEGSAVEDFRRPDRIIIGTTSERVKSKMQLLYASFSRHHDKLLFMKPRSAELSKYAANAMLAAKISFINEISNLAEKVGADIEDVRQGIGSDSRIGYDFIYAGCGYGGSCFPKDVKALSQIAQQHGCEAKLLSAIDQVNEQQKRRLLNHIDDHFNTTLKGKRFAVWGLSYKPQTDDIREASSIVLIEGLLARGATVVAYDPHAIETFKRQYGKTLEIEYSNDMMSALKHADALVICTEWRQFHSPDFKQMHENMHQPVIFDGRNIYEPAQMHQNGFQYYGLGRGLSVNQF